MSVPIDGHKPTRRPITRAGRSPQRRRGASIDVAPHNLEAERSVLGAILLHNDAFGLAAEVIKSADFFRDAHRRIFDKMVTLSERRHAIDLVTLKHELARSGELDWVGGPAYISALVDGVPRSMNVEQYARIVKDAAQARVVIGHAQKAIDTFSHDPAALGSGAGTAFADAVGQAVAAAHTRTDRRVFRTARELAGLTTEHVVWLVPSLLAVGAITELSGKAKLAGKTTLILYLTRCVLDGQPCLGATAMRSPVVFLTEQAPSTFRELLGRAGLLDREDLSILCHADVAGFSWVEVVRLAEGEAVRLDAKLIVVDTLPQFAGLRGDAENNAGDALAVLAPIQQSAARGFAWLITRHERKGAGEVGESGRGSSAFTGAVDVVLRLSRPDGHQRPTVRKLEGLSRFQETPACLLLEKVAVCRSDPGIEVRAETIDAFKVLGDEEAVAVAEARSKLLAILPIGEDAALSVSELVQISERSRAAIQRALDGLLQGGTIKRVGKGKRGIPYRYFRPVEVSDQTSIPEERFEQKESGEVA